LDIVDNKSSLIEIRCKKCGKVFKLNKKKNYSMDCSMGYSMDWCMDYDYGG
jgi:uncharacterized C2H2 Zn-finger protein